MTEKGEPMKQISRSKRWEEAASRALDAVNELVDIQSEYQDWLDGLPENLQNSALADKLGTVCDLDLGTAQDTLEEAGGVELPQGFGRD